MPAIDIHIINWYGTDKWCTRFGVITYGTFPSCTYDVYSFRTHKHILCRRYPACKRSRFALGRNLFDTWFNKREDARGIFDNHIFGPGVYRIDVSEPTIIGHRVILRI